MKDLAETVISIALTLALPAVVYSFYGAHLASAITRAFDSVPK